MRHLPAPAKRSWIPDGLTGLLRDEGPAPSVSAPLVETPWRFFPDAFSPTLQSFGRFTRRLIHDAQYAGLGDLDVGFRPLETEDDNASRTSGAFPVLGWAGWDHLQRARALAAYYLRMKTDEGWPPERLGTWFAAFVADEARALGTTVEALGASRPLAAKASRGRKTRAAV